ncbi:MAG: cysteine--tRNA ligase [Actinobacteria bacterium]|uniref:Cysteine--tRNA ligase n=1 Tax=freshwater metagenome TaxID=449393 RepID=A0A6J6E7X6_9ZZZZ|nr:cysteine--tRNA ligase [Actinomycetota bacterium]
MSSLQLYDTATRTTSAFVPIKAGEVGIYLCGATVQAPPHIGHVRSGVNFDILRRWLTKSGYNVTFIRNVTDIDDKILHKAVHEESPWWAVAMKYERAFTDAYAALNVLPPTYEPRATGHVTQMIELMQLLIERGAAYAPGNGDVYLEVRKLQSYLTLSRQKLDDLIPAADADETYKRDVRDFALWKAAKPGDPSWPTPWGAGRPGWHLECSAMAKAYLGESFDIHGGGLDLIFPHHENEIAQSEAAGYGFAARWMHNAWVTASGEKMSKSLGNSLQVHELLKTVRGIELRWYLGSAHYRSMLEFSHEALAEASTNFRRIEAFLNRSVELLGKVPTPVVGKAFSDAMNDDLAVPTALASISEALRLGNSAITSGDMTTVAQSADEIRGALEVLGCDPFDAVYASQGTSDEITEALDGTIKLALAQREAARIRKDFESSDAIRDGLKALGIVIEDTAQGPRWSISQKTEGSGS